MKRYTLILAFFAFAFGSLYAGDVAFIANPVGTDASISASDIKAVLLGDKTRWDSGTNIHLAVLTEGPANDAVMLEYVQRSSKLFEKHWKKLVFTGKGVMPDQFATETEMVAFVAKTPGAFGYVSSSAVNSSVKQLSVK